MALLSLENTRLLVSLRGALRALGGKMGCATSMVPSEAQPHGCPWVSNTGSTTETSSAGRCCSAAHFVACMPW